MKQNNGTLIKTSESRRGRWTRFLLIALGAVTAVILAMTIETGRLYAQAVGFTFRGALVRVISPNRDGKNDTAIFCFENPKASAVDARIYGLQGGIVSAMIHVKNPPAPAGGTIANCNGKFPSVNGTGGLSNPEAATWDGRAGGTAVPSGVYLYQIKSEDVTVTGTVVVVR